MEAETQDIQRKAKFVIAGSVLAASTGAIFIRYAQQDIPSLVIAAYRLGLATLVIAPFALIKHRKELFDLGRRELFLMLISGVFLALHFGTWISSLEYTSVANSAVLVSMSPLIVAVLSTILLKEPLARSSWFGLFLALTGSVIIALSGQVSFVEGKLLISSVVSSQQSTAILGNFLAFAGSVSVAAYLIIGRGLRQRLSLAPYAFLVFGTAALTLLLACLISGQRLFGYPLQSYIWLVALALIPQILGHASFNWALGYLSATFISIALLGEPIGSTILAFALLKEFPGVIEIVGGMMILLGIFLSSRKNS